ncbi:MAG: FlgD immunoglobulin-like domain containing protein, partial [Gemmatimonadota bacterium]|nr:FlgD immunoglobulin-like domain containing protein [Gemmatimonadota bacterium]
NAGYLKRNFMVAGSDPVAVESVCAQSMGFHPGDIELLRWGRAKGWGYFEPNRIRIVGDPLASVKYEFMPTVGEESGSYYYGRGCTRWLLCGPFEGADLSTNPGGVDPALLDPIAGKALAGKYWTKYISPGTVIDLKQALGPTLENSSVYAFTRIYSPEAQQGKLWVGATEGVTVWINGELVLEGPDNLGYNQKKFEKNLALTAGDNRIMVLLSNTNGDFGFSLACVEDGSNTTRESWVPYSWENSGWTGLKESQDFTGDEKKKFFGGNTLDGTFYHLASGPGETGEPEKMTCDIDGNGMVSIVDVIKFILNLRDSPDDQLDRNGDHIVNITDAIALLLDIMKGNCLEQQGASMAALPENGGLSARAEGLSQKDLEYLESMIRQMELTGEQEAALRIAIYGRAGGSELPRTFTLEQNSPNPFNPSTTIGFSVPASHEIQTVRLFVYDIRGRLVRTLVDGVREPGCYTAYWDGTDAAHRQVASGVYFYRIQAGRFTQTRKMVLLK